MQQLFSMSRLALFIVLQPMAPLRSSPRFGTSRTRLPRIAHLKEVYSTTPMALGEKS